MLNVVQATQHFIAGAANLIGLGGLEKASVAKDSAEIGCMPVVRAIALGLYESTLGLIPQPSLFAPAFQHTDKKSRRKQLLYFVIT